MCFVAMARLRDFVMPLTGRCLLPRSSECSRPVAAVADPGADNNGKMVPITKVRIKANPTSLSPLLVGRRFACRQLSDSRSSYHKSGQSIAPRVIAIRIDPQIIDVPRDAAGFTVEVRYSLETN